MNAVTISCHHILCATYTFYVQHMIYFDFVRGLSIKMCYWQLTIDNFIIHDDYSWVRSRGGSTTVATSKMEHFVKPLTIIRKSSILAVAAVLDQPLRFWICFSNFFILSANYN